jgi:hypothetical protein
MLYSVLAFMIRSSSITETRCECMNLLHHDILYIICGEYNDAELRSHSYEDNIKPKYNNRRSRNCQVAADRLSYRFVLIWWDHVLMSGIFPKFIYDFLSWLCHCTSLRNSMISLFYHSQWNQLLFASSTLLHVCLFSRSILSGIITSTFVYKTFF